MDREPWTVHGVTKSWTRLGDYTHTHTQSETDEGTCSERPGDLLKIPLL